MLERTHYSNAPILEALIDIQVMPREGMILEGLAPLIARLKTKFPQVQQIAEMTIMMQGEVGGEMHGATSQKPTALRLENTETHQVVVVRPEGMTFSLQAPYDRWEILLEGAQDVWRSYREVCAPQQITRLATRYINRFDLPATIDHLRDYLHIVPTLPASFPGAGLTSYVMQYQIPQPDLDAMLVVNTGRAPSDSPGTLSVIMDFDLFRVFSYPDEAGAELLMWDYLEQLHQRKNEVFESILTEETRRLIA